MAVPLKISYKQLYTKKPRKRRVCCKFLTSLFEQKSKYNFSNLKEDIARDHKHK